MGPDCIAKLTEKQRACLRLVLMHYSSKEIARELGIGVDAVDQRLKGAMKNLGVQNRVEAARILAQYEGHPMGVHLGEPRPGGMRGWFGRLAKGLGKLWPRTRRARFIFWVALFASITGALDLWVPLEEYLRDQRVAMRQHPASGDVIVVGIDDRTVEAFGNGHLPRARLAELVRRLDQSGAEYVILAIHGLSRRTSPREDAALAAALWPLGDRAVVLAGWQEDPRTGKRTAELPLREFSKNASLAHGTMFLAPRVARFVPYYIDVEGQTYPSLQYVVAGSVRPKTENMPIDYGVDPKTLPVLSAADVLKGTVREDKIKHKTVLIGEVNVPLVDQLTIPGHGKAPSVIVRALATETLEAGMPVVVPWWILFAPALLVAFLVHRSKEPVIWILAIGGSIVIFLIIPYFLERHLIFVRIMPPLFLLAAIGAGLIWSRLRRRRHAAESFNRNDQHAL